MGNINYEKKCEHEMLAIKALSQKDYASTFKHVKLAAEFTYILAKTCPGKMGEVYLATADGLLEVAGKLGKMVTKSGRKNNEPDGTDEIGRMMELPKEKLSDVAGMEAAKLEIKLSVIDPIGNPEKAKKYGLKKGGAVLFYGLPGTGKTFFAKAVAGELGLPFYEIKTDEIFTKYAGVAGERIGAVFKAARMHPMSVVFVDETNGVLSKRGDDNLNQTSLQVVDIVLKELSGADSDRKNPFLLIGATNYPNKLDDAMIDRFNAIIEVELPVVETRRFILKRELSSMAIPIEDGVIAWLADKTEGCSCREVVKLANVMRKAAARDEIEKLTAAFCEQNYQDVHIDHLDVAKDIQAFKERLG